MQNLTTTNSSTYTIIPKIQSTYGFSDWGSYINNIDGNAISSFDTDGTIFLTTHKIGYEDKDRYATGENTCNSYLFLSPVNHNEIQVDGDTLESSKSLKEGETLKVPIIYQFRMTDYNGYIFGNSKKKLKESSTIVKNTKYANIIGIDIWTDRNALKPKQYDIIIYSTYGGTIETDTNRTRLSSTQALINVGGDISKNLGRLVKDNSTLSSRSTITPRVNTMR